MSQSAAARIVWFPLAALVVALALVPVLQAGDEGEGTRSGQWRRWQAAGVEHEGAGRLDAACRAYEQAARRAEEQNLTERAVESLYGLLRCLPQTDYLRYRDVTAWLLSFQRRGADAESLADTLMDLGYLQTALGRPLEGIRALEEAAALLAGDASLEAQARARLAYALSSAGQLAAALSVGEQAAAVFRRDDDAMSLAETLIVLADIHVMLQDSPRTLALVEEGLSLSAERPPSLDATFEFFRGEAHVLAGRHRRGLECLDAARQIFETAGVLRGAAYALIRIGDVHRQQGELDEAFHDYTAARKHAEDYDAPRSMAQLRVGDLCLERGQTGAARTLYELSLALAGKNLEPRSEAHRGLADVCLRSADVEGARVHAFEALDAIDGMVRGLAPITSFSARGGNVRLFQTARRVAFGQEDLGAAFELLERTRAATLLEGLGGHGAVAGRRAGALSGREEQSARERVLATQTVLEEAIDAGVLAPVRAARREHERAREAYQDLWNRAQRAVPTDALATGGRRLRLEDATAMLAPSDALVLYAFEGGRLRALVVRPGGARVVDVGREDVVLETLDALREAIVKRRDVRDPFGDASAPGSRRLPATDLAGLLRDRLVDPLGLSRDVRRLLICPHGSLATVPWGVVLPRHTVVLVPSATAYAALRRQSSERGTGILALGDVRPSKASRLDPLELSRAEVEGIRGDGDVALLGDDASEAAFREAVSKRPRWRAVHFACHGFADRKRPAWSSLVLTPSGTDDGYLAVLELLGLRIPADVAVLSACETGLGASVDGEGLLGLASAFLYAGSTRVVASLWKVDDAATAALMESFHALHAPRDGGESLSAAAALRQAQEHVRTHPDHPERWSHPCYWAGWVLWGLAD